MRTCLCLGPIILEGLISTVAHGGYPIYTKKKNMFMHKCNVLSDQFFVDNFFLEESKMD